METAKFTDSKEKVITATINAPARFSNRRDAAQNGDRFYFRSTLMTLDAQILPTTYNHRLAEAEEAYCNYSNLLTAVSAKLESVVEQISAKAEKMLDEPKSCSGRRMQMIAHPHRSRSVRA
jgi:hypothetical protein